FSKEVNPEIAASLAATQAIERCDSSHIDFAIVYCSIHYDPKVILPIIKKFLNTPNIIGSSTAGIILSDRIETRGISILAIHAGEIKFGCASIEQISSDKTFESGTEFARTTLQNFGSQGGRQLYIFYFDGQLENTTTFLKGVQEVLGSVFPIVGGGSSDDYHFDRSFQIFNDQVLKNSACGILLGGGQFSVGVSGRHGWKPVGRPRIVTQSQGNVIYKIDDQVAAKIYEEYFGGEVENMRLDQFGRIAILYPLGIYVEGSEEYLLRNAISVQADGSIVCQGNVPDDSSIHIMIGNKESCKDAVSQAAQEAKKNLLGKPPKLVLVMESIARLKLLGRQAKEEIGRIQKIFGSNTPIFGMYTYGEICPFQSMENIRKPFLQNESVIVLAIA
ncbi:MAG: FIST C-terminal domain-containing protein, partial [Candidatus Omnitrophica bacterium]|nr:FIST C-terminal domain-containing protein [Candidatus Omnitrophota bacterium]